MMTAKAHAGLWLCRVVGETGSPNVLVLGVGDDVQLEEHLDDDLQSREAEDEGDQKAVQPREGKANDDHNHRNDVCDGDL